MIKEAIIGISIGVALILVIALSYAIYNRVQETNLMESIASGHQVAIRVVLDDGLSDLQVDYIVEELLAHPEVVEITNRVVCETAEALWEEFRERYFSIPDSDDVIILTSPSRIDEDYLEIFVTSEETWFFTLLLGVDNLQRTISEIVEYAESIEGVRRVSRNTVRR